MPSVKDLMTKDVITISSSETAYDAAVLMTERNIGCLIIIDGTAPVGITTERDIVRKVVYKRLHPHETKISEIMSKPLVTIDPDSSLRDAARLMVKNAIRRLPITRENRLVGILVSSDFAKHLGKENITEEILNAIARYPPELAF